jgi:peroxiredoxin
MRHLRERISMSRFSMLNHSSKCVLILTIILIDVNPFSIKATEKTAAELEFNLLRNEYNRVSDLYNKMSEKLDEETTEDVYLKLYLEEHPDNRMINQFLELEIKYRGTAVGFSALHHLVTHASSVGDNTFPVSVARITALDILSKHYADNPNLDLVMRWLNTGPRQIETRKYLRLWSNSNQREVRGNARYTLAKILCKDVTVPAQLKSKFELFKEYPDKFADEIKRYSKIMKKWDVPHPEESRREAVQLIKEIKEEYADVLESKSTQYGPILFQNNGESSEGYFKTNRRQLGVLAEGLEFTINHLIVGREAPEIDQPDAFGKPLKLSDYRGKVVVIMFSFKGCGPCEAMYPGNRKLLEKYQDQPFAFLGIMGDDEVKTIKEAVEEKKITWPVWWNGGHRGPLSTKWNVSGWPEIYVIDHHGIIRYRELTSKMLESAVEKLMKELP